MRRLSALLWPILLLASCMGGQRASQEQAAEGQAVHGCRVGPGGTRLAEDRGIGGTGITSAPAPTPRPNPLPVETHDRGIGGTGINPHETEQPMDLAANGQGIVGAITGFGSVCVNGAEVQAAPILQVHAHDGQLDAGRLRAGLVIALTVAPIDGTLQASDIAVLHAVTGLVDAVLPGGRIVVTGQRVAITDATWGVIAPKLGDWVAVSGFRDPDATIIATRIDPAAPGRVVVHGVLRQTTEGPMIGLLRLQPNDSASALEGQPVIASGTLVSGILRLDALIEDVLAAAPQEYFGPGVSDLSIESYVTLSTGFVAIGSVFNVATHQGVSAAPGLSVATLHRQGDRLVATGLLSAPGPGEAGPANGGLPSALPSAPGYGPSSPGRQGAGPAPGGASFSPAPTGSTAPMPDYGQASPDAQGGPGALNGDRGGSQSAQPASPGGRPGPGGRQGGPPGP